MGGGGTMTIAGVGDGLGVRGFGVRGVGVWTGPGGGVTTTSVAGVGVLTATGVEGRPETTGSGFRLSMKMYATEAIAIVADTMAMIIRGVCDLCDATAAIYA
jgi:hypothetical protein